MIARLWYPQLDVYDSIRRIGALLSNFESPPSAERLYITDFFLANPPLLHRTQMLQHTRKAFLELRIPRPEKTFLSYPAASLLFHKMELIQKEALSALSGKGLISVGGLKKGLVEMTALGHEILTLTSSNKCTANEIALIIFLTQDFVTSISDNPEALRRSTGLRRPT